VHDDLPSADDRLSDASLLIGLLEYDRAEEVLRSVLADAEGQRDDVRASLAYEALGTIATRRGRETEARRLLERSLELAGDADPVERELLYWNLARICSGLGDPDRAVEILERALSLFDTESDLAARVALQVALSYAYTDVGAYGRAGAVLADLIQRGAEELDARARGRINYARGRLSTMLGYTDQAVEQSRLAVEDYLESGDEYPLADAYLLLAMALLEASRTEEAVEALRRAEQLYGPRPGDVDRAFLLTVDARCQLQLGQADGAVDSARQAIELLGDQSMVSQLGEVYVVLARAYEERGDAAAADRSYEKAIGLLERHQGWYRDLSRAYRWYGKFLRREGRDAAAMEMLEKAGDISLRLEEMLRRQSIF
jgi:tetratricopeptide (TPR) repeat protein